MANSPLSPESEALLLVPEAYLEDGRGIRLVVRVGDDEDYALLSPPDYDLASGERGAWVKDAALAKYGFSPYEGPAVVTSDAKQLAALCKKQIEESG